MAQTGTDKSGDAENGMRWKDAHVFLSFKNTVYFEIMIGSQEVTGSTENSLVPFTRFPLGYERRILTFHQYKFPINCL